MHAVVLILMMGFLNVTNCGDFPQDDVEDANKSPDNSTEALTWYLRYYDEFYCHGDHWTDIPPPTKHDAAPPHVKHSNTSPSKDRAVQHQNTRDLQPWLKIRGYENDTSTTNFSGNTGDFVDEGDDILAINMSDYFDERDASTNITDPPSEFAGEDYVMNINDYLDEADTSSQSNLSENFASPIRAFFPWHFGPILDFDDWVSYDEDLSNNSDDYIMPLDQKNDNISIVNKSGNVTGIWMNISNDEVHFRKDDRDMLHLPSTPTKLWKYFSPPLAIGGTIGNVLTLSVFCRKRFMKKSVTMYLIFLTIADTILLDVDLSYRWLKVVTDFDMKLISDASCKLHSFGIYLLHQLTSWMIVLATVDRSFTLFYPWWARDIFSHVCSAVLIGVTCLLVVIFNVHFLLTQELFLVYHKQTGASMMTCSTYLQRHRWFVHSIWPWIDLSIFAFVPFTVVIICNGGIIVQLVLLYARQKRTQVLESSSSTADTTRSRSGKPMIHVLAPTAETQQPSTSRPTQRRANVTKIKAFVAASTLTGPKRNLASVPAPDVHESPIWNPKLNGTTKMVFFISMCFLFTNLPLSVVLMGETHWLIEASDEKKEELHIIWVVVHLLSNIFSACKFVLYWSISRRFRKTFCRMFTKQRVDPGETLMDEQNTADNETVF